ncbi:MAG: D-alanyl-D-alanine carboxypeptidase [Hyphomicrobiales bacterium]|nr:D-alanyl-D-alanine carboxypeptidase [Hyphomicrobiales bacterium]MDE2114898.1 D-alanyl-D-alanine carboxypeptidase [Hyphomicrobiales bacterium]
MGNRSVVSGRIGFAAIASLLILGTVASPAEARHRHLRHHGHARHHLVHRAHGHHVARHGGYSPPFSDIVVDAKSGRILSGVDIDAPRHPASLTKVMTLYLLFEQLAKGKMTLQTELPVSRHAAAQAPTKLGIPAGSHLPVEAAIKSIVTQSANDMAVVVAEKIGGTEAHFAEMMTAKAHQLGMMHTNYADASGLPNPRQLTTARDLAILGRAIQESFPQYYHYFSVRHYTYAGRNMHNHNHMLNYVEGMDGIKTGFTNASGFNLLTSVHRDGRRIVSVVLGGTSWRGRDAIMAKLISANLERGANVRTARLIRDQDLPAGETRTAEADKTANQSVEASARPTPIPEAEPSHLRQVPVPHGTAHSLELAAVVPPLEHPTVRRFQPAVISATLKLPAAAPPETKSEEAVAPAALVKNVRYVRDGSTRAHVLAQATREPPHRTDVTPAALGWVAGPKGRPSHETEATRAINAIAPQHSSASKGVDRDSTASLPAKKAEADSGNADEKGWVIQIGATGTAELAHTLLDRAKVKNARVLASTHAITEKVQKGKTTIYRARFGGLQMASANAACKSLKRTGFSCFATKN